MSSEPVLETVSRFVIDTFPLARSRAVGADDRLIESGVVDSLGVLSLVGFVEETFGIAVDDDDLVTENFETIACVTAFVEKKRAALSLR